MRVTPRLVVALWALAACTSRGRDAGCAAQPGEIGSAICASAELRRLDRELASRREAVAARLAPAEAARLRDDQARWAAERDSLCQPRAAEPVGLSGCLASAFRTRLDDLASLAACTGPQPPPTCRLDGEWTVVSVRVGPGQQALVPDDTLYLRKVLRGDPGELAFADDRCRGPRFEAALRSPREWFEEHFGASPSGLGWNERPLRRALVLRARCESGNLGPAAAGGSEVIVRDADEVGLSYYDGAFLILRRAR